jgi:hypothetical protein
MLFAGVSAAQGPAKKGLAVHEWGVFRVSEDEDFANAHLRQEWDKLPPFVYGHIKGRVVPQHWGPIEVRLRPIIFFHAAEPMIVTATIQFPGGMPGVWYPATQSPATDGNERQPKVGSVLEWNIGVKQCPNGWMPRSPAPAAVDDGHWFTRIRQVKAEEIFARFGPRANDVEREKFIYYDGLFPQGKWLKFEVTNDKVAVTNRVKHSVFDVTVVDRRGDKPRIGRIAKLEPGETIKQITFTEVDASRFSSESSETLTKQLIGVGLFEDEAKSLVDLWKKNMFETPGLHAFYRIPQAEYDARMPLTVTRQQVDDLKYPPPTVVRAGLIFHGHLEPDFAERILELVKKLDADTYAERDAAMKKLLVIGPAALVEIKRLQKKANLSIEVKERIDALVRKWDAKEAFDLK